MSNHFEGGGLKTAGKLLILDKYLPAYLKIMKRNWNNDIWYVDTNSGTGKTWVDDVLLDGSALTALTIEEHSFDQYHLFENDRNHFNSLVETIESEIGVEVTIDPVATENFDFLVARSRNPRIEIYNTDSNQWVRHLAQKSDPQNHWFSFLDPGGMELDMDTVDALVTRDNMDLLINFQVSGIHRSAAADHALPAAERVIGIEDLDAEDMSIDDWTEMYCNRLQDGRDDWKVISKKMVDHKDRRNRFDMVFAARNKTARKIIRDIWNHDNFWPDARQFIEEEREGDQQTNLGNF